MHDKILDMLMQRDEITWQSIIYDLVKTGELDPWDIDISVLTNSYLLAIKKMQEANLFISGKVLLASAILLKLKSEKLLTEGIAVLDAYLFPSEEEIGNGEISTGRQRIELQETPKLTIKTPLTRKRKVNINDLISALEKALEVSDRRVLRITERQRVPGNIIIPEKPMDITKMIKELYSKIKEIFKDKPIITFTELVPSHRKEDKIATFIPLLHLDHQEKISLEQEMHFSEINIRLVKEKELVESSKNASKQAVHEKEV